MVVIVIYSLLKIAAEKGACRKRKWSKTGSLSLLFDAVYARLNVNVALGRPTSSSSVFSSGLHGEYPPSKAVDGNGDTAAMKLDHSCFNSEFQDDPWWSVDLGTAVAVVGVLFTNRGEGYGNETVHTTSIPLRSGFSTAN